MRARGFPTAFGSGPPQRSSGMKRSPGTNAPERQAKHMSTHWPSPRSGQRRSVFARSQAGPRPIEKASELDSLIRQLNWRIQLSEKPSMARTANSGLPATLLKRRAFVPTRGRGPGRRDRHQPSPAVYSGIKSIDRPTGPIQGPVNLSSTSTLPRCFLRAHCQASSRFDHPGWMGLPC
jgi:hypothetical protein